MHTHSQFFSSSSQLFTVILESPISLYSDYGKRGLLSTVYTCAWNLLYKVKCTRRQDTKKIKRYSRKPFLTLYGLLLRMKDVLAFMQRILLLLSMAQSRPFSLLSNAFVHPMDYCIRGEGEFNDHGSCVRHF